METKIGLTLHEITARPHSLGKLIEWKQVVRCPASTFLNRPHSLGKLIEWKRSGRVSPRARKNGSPLAGETN